MHSYACIHKCHFDLGIWLSPANLFLPEIVAHWLSTLSVVLAFGAGVEHRLCLVLALYSPQESTLKVVLPGRMP